MPRWIPTRVCACGECRVQPSHRKCPKRWFPGDDLLELEQNPNAHQLYIRGDIPRGEGYLTFTEYP